MLDTYTLEQMETLAQCVWQHKLTQFNVVAYAIGGKGASERVPGTDVDVPEHDGPTIGWENAKGRWNIARRDADGRIVEVRPTITPEQDQRMKERALSQLLGVQSAMAATTGAPPPKGIPTTTAPPVVTGNPASDAVARMRAQLDGASKPGGS